jgi:membrane-bound lytic murein transglycosylase F
MTHFKSKGWLLIKAFLVFVLVAHACQQAHKFNESELLSLPSVEFDKEDIVRRGKLIALVDENATSFYIYKGRPMGMDYELLRELADRMGVRLEIRKEPNLEKAFEALNMGDADILAYGLHTTDIRNRKMAFTTGMGKSRQMLVQRKPENWRTMGAAQIEAKLIRNIVALGGKTVSVRKASAHAQRIRKLSEEIGTEIGLREMSGIFSTEQLVQKVANSEIDFTIVDEHEAELLNVLYPNLDFSTALSAPMETAWAIRHNAPELQVELNIYIQEVTQSGKYASLFQRYFKNSFNHAYRLRSIYSSLRGDRISPFDEDIKAAADRLGWDWKILAALIYQESKFETEVESVKGAQGLMQIMPATAERFGAEDPFDPSQSLQAGVRYLEYLNRFWMNRIQDPNERMKFILASYNAGQGHVLDAYNLTSKFGKNPHKWDNVEEFLLKKSDPVYYNDPVVKSGFCRGQEPVNYVREVLERYQHYKQFYS